jgi:hypothetical protein
MTRLNDIAEKEMEEFRQLYTLLNDFMDRVYAYEKSRRSSKK